MASAGLGAGSLALSGCGSMMVNATEAEVRFVDTSVDAPALDIYVNGAGAAYNLGYATFTSYVPLGAGNYQFHANRASTGQALVSHKAALVSGHQYTVVVGNRLGDLQEHVYTDPPAVAVAGTLAVRVLNEVGNGPLDVYVVPNASSLATAAPVVTSLGYGAGSAYVRLPTGGSNAVFAVPAGASPLSAGALRVNGASISGASGAARTLILTESTAAVAKGLYGIVLDDSETP